MLAIAGVHRIALAVAAAALVYLLFAVGPIVKANAQAAPLQPKDLVDAARALLAKGPQAAKYVGRKFQGDGKYRSGPIQGANPPEIEFADFAVVGRLSGVDEVHISCTYAPADPALKVLSDLVAHAMPVLTVSGTVTGAERTDSEGKTVAFVKLRNCSAVKKG